jgi:hypothetical protein
MKGFVWRMESLMTYGNYACNTRLGSTDVEFDVNRIVMTMILCKGPSVLTLGDLRGDQSRELSS